MFALSMLVWASGQLIYDDTVVGAWLLFLAGGIGASLGLRLAVGDGPGSPGRSHTEWLSWSLTAMLVLVGISGALDGAARMIAVSAGMTLLVVGFVHAMAQLRRAQQRLAELAVIEERQRVAADVHDIVGHALAVTMLHVNAARMSLPERPEAAIEALEEAERNGRSSMNEIRGVVRLLHSDDTPSLQSLPDLDDLPVRRSARPGRRRRRTAAGSRPTSVRRSPSSNFATAPQPSCSSTNTPSSATDERRSSRRDVRARATTLGSVGLVWGDEDAERVTGRVGEDVERLICVVRSIVQHPGAERNRPGALFGEVIGAGNGQVEVELLWHPRVRPGRRRKLVDGLDSQTRFTVSVHEHEPVVALRVGLTGGWGLVACPVPIAEEFAVELGEVARIGGVECHGAQNGKACGHRLILSPRRGHE